MKKNIVLSIVVLVLLTSASILAMPYPYNLESRNSFDQSDPGQSRELSSSANAVTGDIFGYLDAIDVRTPSAGTAADCWGWQAPDGQEYAIVGHETGVTFVNATTMQIVAQVDDICGSGGLWRDVKTYGNYCYAVTECGGTGRGLLIIDMSGLPFSVREVKTVATSHFNSWHNISIDTARGFAHLGKQNNGFLMMDLADPENPVEVGWVNSGGCHDLVVFNDTAWVAEAWNPTWSIWNLSNKSAPELVARVTVSEPGFVHQIWPSEDRSYVVTTEETATKTIKIWDTSDLENIRFVSEFLGPSQLAHNVLMKGDTAFISHYESGVVAYDLSDIANPVEIDRYDTYLPSENSNFNGCWGIYPYTQEGGSYGSNMEGTVHIFGNVGMRSDIYFGEPPLAVSFEGLSSHNVISWEWDWGDGTTSSVMNPDHIYTEAGLYSPSLIITTADSSYSAIGTKMISVMAESLLVASVTGEPLEKIRVDIYAVNHLPATRFIVPIAWDGPLFLSLDSVSTQGLRTEYMGTPGLIHSNQVAKAKTFEISSNTPVAEGNGPIMSAYFQLPIIQLAGSNPIDVSGYGIYLPKITTVRGTYVASTTIGNVTMGCCVGMRGNADNSPDQIVDIGDLTRLIDYLFISMDELECLEEANTDGEGVVDIGDLTVLIDYLFISMLPLDNCQ